MSKFIAVLALATAPMMGLAGPGGLPDFADLAEKQGASVVNISTTTTVRQDARAPQMPNIPEDDPAFDLFRRFFPPGPNGPGGPNGGMPGQPREQESHSLGSGFITSADGYILTNAHVVDGADEVTVKLSDKREFKARVIGADKRTDVALIKIEGRNLQAVALGDPARLRVGEWVVAIGSPFGFESTVTAGIVSAKGRSLPQENFVPFIQTDVAINPGNSGGPLFNLKGEVVGINSQIYSRTGGFMGLSFAIPIDVAMDIAEQLKTNGKVTRGRIGVVIQEVTKDLAETFGLAKPAGALVSAVDPDGPAAKAGVEAGDIILRFNGKAINNSGDLPRTVASVKPGTRSTLQVWRKGASRELGVTVAELTDDESAPPRGPQRKRNDKPPQNVGKLGLGLSELTGAQRRQLDVKGGVVVEEVLQGGLAAKAGLRRGDVILQINDEEVKSIDQFNQLLTQFEKRKRVALRVKRGDGTLFLPLQLDSGS
ncbi:MAG: DegQ family serine endoprotease [Rhodocyclaceae bacterium]|nr:DegQ family serine endoprotease [Rhodocyclaceae bacterium]